MRSNEGEVRRGETTGGGGVSGTERWGERPEGERLVGRGGDDRRGRSQWDGEETVGGGGVSGTGRETAGGGGVSGTGRRR